MGNFFFPAIDSSHCFDTSFFLPETYLQGISMVSYVCHSIETLMWSVFVVLKPSGRVEVGEKGSPEEEKFGSHIFVTQNSVPAFSDKL